MKMRRHFAICAVILSLCLMSGCWSSADMNELAFIMGIAVDKEPENAHNDYTVTVQVAKPGKLNLTGGGTSGGASDNAYVNYTEQGVGIYEAIHKMAMLVNRELYSGHNQVIVISQEVAKSDISSILDHFIRTAEGRFTALLFISEGNARDVFDVGSELEHLPVMHLKTQMDMQSKYGEIKGADFLTFLSNMMTQTTAPTVPIVSIIDKGNDEKALQIDGMAVFKDSAICTTLNLAQGQAMLLLQNDAENGIVTIESADAYTSLKINKSSAKMASSFAGDMLEKITVSLELGCSVADTDENIELLTQQARDELGRRAADVLSAQLYDALHHTQRFGVDVFGFGEYLHRYHPIRTEQLLANWGEEYAHLTVEFDVHVEILSTGAVLRLLVPEGPADEAQ